MQQSVNITLSPEQAANDKLLKNEACAKAGVQPQRVKIIRIEHKTVDARQRMPKINLSVRLYIDEESQGAPRICEEIKYQDVSAKPQAIVVGAGPAGLFAALRLIELGVKPIIVERGKSVSERKIDIAQASRNKGLNLESNFSFGEGGAGAFSDGKLYTRSKKKGNTYRILQIFHDHGAQDEILY